MTAAPQAFEQVQHLVLCAPRVGQVQHLLLRFDRPGSAARRFLQALRKRITHQPGGIEPPLLRSLGLSYRGLEALGLPLHVGLVLQKLAPAFSRGAALQASTRLGDTGASAPLKWDAAFRPEGLHAVYTLHHGDPAAAADDTGHVQALAREFGVTLLGEPLRGEDLRPPGREGRWVHFGYRDGISRVRVEGFSPGPCEPAYATPTLAISRHQPGEFLLGHVDDAGTTPWALATQPAAVRSFFHEASFGILRQIEQDEAAFRGYLREQAAAMTLPDGRPMPRETAEALVQAKLCGRFADGRRIDPDTQQPFGGPEDDFDYQADKEGRGCPFGAHTRRMNPRGDDIAHDRRKRPLMRRGTPYGPPWHEGEPADAGISRGLLGLFFCSSIEGQFEHLMGEWADRVPMGSREAGRAKDPLAAHQEGERCGLDLPGAPGGLRRLDNLRPFVRTRGTAYLLYPTASGLEQLATEDHGRRWVDEVDRKAFE